MGLLALSSLTTEMADAEQQVALRRNRRLPYVQRSIRRTEFPNQLEEGWYTLKELKGAVRVAKNKPPDVLLEDELWLLFSEMGFGRLSVDRNVSIKYGSQPSERQQVDVLAVDEECALVVEFPATLFEKLYADAAKKNREIESQDDEKGPWDCMYIINYRDVLSYGSNWSTLFQKRFTIPGQEKLKKDDKTAWLVRLNNIRNQNTHDRSVAEEDYRFVVALHDWLINDDPDSIATLAKLDGGTDGITAE